jgi:hypothetical protein
MAEDLFLHGLQNIGSLLNVIIIPLATIIVGKKLLKEKKATRKLLTQKTNLRAITVFDQGGIPLTSSSNEDILQGGLFTAIHNFVRESFNKELDQLKMGGHLIVFKRSKHLMGSIILNDNDNVDVKEAESDLNDLLSHLEHMCPELEKEQLDSEKIEYLVEQYASNLL